MFTRIIEESVVKVPTTKKETKKKINIRKNRKEIQLKNVSHTILVYLTYSNKSAHKKVYSFQKFVCGIYEHPYDTVLQHSTPTIQT